LVYYNYYCLGCLLNYCYWHLAYNLYTQQLLFYNEFALGKLYLDFLARSKSSYQWLNQHEAK